MRISKIVNNSTAEVEGHFSDIIFFQGCNRRCGFCFNPELQEDGGYEEGGIYTVEQVLERLSDLSDVVVLTGGDPLCQDLEELILCLRLRGKKIVLETSMYSSKIWKWCDKVLYSMKTFDPEFWTIQRLHLHNNVIPVVVIGHPWFNQDNFLKMLMRCKVEIYVRYYNDKPCDISIIYPRIRRFQTTFKVFKKIWI